MVEQQRFSVLKVIDGLEDMCKDIEELQRGWLGRMGVAITKNKTTTVTAVVALGALGMVAYRIFNSRSKR